jgi:hypothetical protein
VDSARLQFLLEFVSIPVDRISQLPYFEEGYDVCGYVHQFPKIVHIHSLPAHWKERESPAPDGPAAAGGEISAARSIMHTKRVGKVENPS